jgi:hypothetical protein
MKLNIIVITAFILIVSCIRNDKEKNTGVSSKSQNVEEKSISDTSLYLQIGNPDTALAIFVFEKCYNYDYDLQREEYIRWDLEHDKLQPLVDTLFHKRNDYNVRMKQIRDNSVKFLDNARKMVVSDSRQYNVISDMMEFQYLVTKKDSLLKGLISDMLKNPKVEKAEKLALEGALRRW